LAARLLGQKWPRLSGTRHYRRNLHENIIHMIELYYYIGSLQRLL
jgi:hypothetical protein